MRRSLIQLKKNKKGIGNIILFGLILFGILLIGFVGTILIGVVHYSSNTITPVFTNLGVIGDTNLSQAGESTFGMVNTAVNTFHWIMAFGFICALIFSVIFIGAYQTNPNPAYIGFYFLLVVLLILGSIVVSNMYQDLYQSNDIVGQELQQQSVMSYAILYSPIIFGVIGLLTGIYLFAGKTNEGGGDV